MKVKQALLNRIFPVEREFQPVAHGLFGGCEMYLSMRHQFHVCYGTYEREIAAHFRHCAEDCVTFLDIGAAEGYYAVYMMRNTNARVLAFEPEGESRALLMNNLARNGDSEGRSMVSHRFVGDENGVGEDESAAVTTVDAMLDRLAEGPVFLKIDVEGAEAAVLRGATQVLAMPSTRLIVETHGEQEELDCIEILQGAGYHTEVIGQAWWRCVLNEGRTLEHNRWLVATQPQGLAG
jgi:FkbM family methyltransferase